jgi:sorting and assembly machinery component 37
MMPLELHVWGPGFGLPSIDAECLGAIAYLLHCLPDEEWKVVSNSDPKACPLGELPALKDGDQWVSRFSSIVAYLSGLPNVDWDLDGALSGAQKADCFAFTSFIESRGQPLLDLSFYVSSENYNGSTKTALSQVLTWPGSWTIPGKLRDRAKKRSEHLGLSSLDVDAALEDAKTKDTGLTAQIPERLRSPKQTVSALLGKNAAKDRFRLDAVTAEFMEPIEELLGRKEQLQSKDVTSLDCLAIGYLALMQQPDLPQDWLKDALHKKYTRLGQWSEAFAKSTFERPLRWRVPEPVTGSGRILAIVETLVGALPVVGRNRAAIELPETRSSSEKASYVTKQKAVRDLRNKQGIFDQIVFSSLGFGIFIGYMFWAGLLVLPRRAAKPSRRDFGAAGAMLGLGLT